MSESFTTNRKQTYAGLSIELDRAVRYSRYFNTHFIVSGHLQRLDVLLICPAPHRAAISHYIRSDTSSASFPSLRIDLQTYDESQDDSVGTCTILRHFSQRIQHDFIILPCDFVPPPSLSLSQVVNKFRTESTYDGALATACFFQAPRPEKNSTVDEWGPLFSPSPIVWDERSGTLLYMDTPDDVDKNGEEIELRMSLLSQYVSLRSP